MHLSSLYEKISANDTADLTCPWPPTPTSTNPTQDAGKQSQGKCSHCRQPGHTKTIRGVITCPQLYIYTCIYIYIPVYVWNVPHNLVWGLLGFVKCIIEP